LLPVAKLQPRFTLLVSIQCRSAGGRSLQKAHPLVDAANGCVESMQTMKKTFRPETLQTTIEQSFRVDFSYPVVFTRDLFCPENPILAHVLRRIEANRIHRALVYVDEGVVQAQPELKEQIMAYFHDRSDQLELVAPPQTAKGGPGAKNGWGPIREIMWSLGSLHIDRQSFVVAVGGGSMLDMIGFAAGIVHRGVRLVRVPTTTLAQNDSGVGVKNGMDEHGQKNFVGTFAPPFAVINDATFLRTLSSEHWVGGVAEAVKVAAIKDADFLRCIRDWGPALRRRDREGVEAMQQVVYRCAELHLEHIRTSGDPFEFGSARPLDFGHWAGHKIETMSHYGIGHGQAVSIGIAIDAYYARRTGHITEADFDTIVTALTGCGLPIFHSCLLERNENGALRVLDGLREFREHLGGVLCITLPSPIGRKTEIHRVEPSILEDAIVYLRGLSSV